MSPVRPRSSSSSSRRRRRRTCGRRSQQRRHAASSTSVAAIPTRCSTSSPGAPPPPPPPPGPPLPVGDGPGAVSAFSGQMHTFGRGQDDALWVRHAPAGTGAGWAYLGGVLTSAPAAASRAPGQVDVFARGLDNALWGRTFDGASWGPWIGLGGILSSAPAVVSRAPARSTCSSPASTERSGTAISTATTGADGPPSAGSSSDLPQPRRGHREHWRCSLVVRTTPSGPESSTGELERLGEPGRNPVDGAWAASRSPGTYDVFARGNDNAVWRRTA